VPLSLLLAGRVNEINKILTFDYLVDLTSQKSGTCEVSTRCDLARSASQPMSVLRLCTAIALYCIVLFMFSVLGTNWGPTDRVLFC